jgi:arginyl-tRNA synthetase
MYRMLETEATKSIEDAINLLGWEKPDDIKFEEPPHSDLGDIATSIAFQLAKNLKRSPVEISQEIIGSIRANKTSKKDIFRKVESTGPYINFFIDYDIFSRKVLSSVGEEFGKLDPKKQRVIVEHTSANPNGPLHIGHIRNSIIGDSLSRVLRSAGWEVETQYYVNDMGRQIAMIVWGLLNGHEIDENDKSDHAIGKVYFQINEELNQNPELKGEVNAIIKLYEKGEDPEVEKVFKKVVEKCLAGIKSTSNQLNIIHDAFVWESQFVKDGSVAELLKSLQNYIQQNEVPYLDLQEYGIEKELILTRSDGTSLYSTRDIAYHLQKSRDADEIIDVLGSDHKLAVDQIKIVLNLLGGKSPQVIFYEFITLPEGSMSTRRGVFISVDQLIEEATERAGKEIEKRREDLEESEKKKIAEMIGIGAIRYYIARLSPEKHIVFKWDEALSFERGCASIQYAHARACKLLQMAGKFKTGEFSLDNREVPLETELQPAEIELIKTISKLPSMIEESARIKRVHKLAQYVLDLAGDFNKFYKSTPVIGSENEPFRLLLVDRARITIRNSLELLGIGAPESM